MGPYPADDLFISVYIAKTTDVIQEHNGISHFKSCREDQTGTTSWNSKSHKCQDVLWGTVQAAKHPPVSQAIVSAMTRVLECLPYFTMSEDLIYLQKFFFPRTCQVCSCSFFSEEQRDSSNLRLLSELHGDILKLKCRLLYFHSFLASLLSV